MLFFFDALIILLLPLLPQILELLRFLVDDDNASAAAIYPVANGDIIDIDDREDGAPTLDFDANIDDTPLEAAPFLTLRRYALCVGSCKCFNRDHIAPDVLLNVVANCEIGLDRRDHNF